MAEADAFLGIFDDVEQGAPSPTTTGTRSAPVSAAAMAGSGELPTAAASGPDISAGATTSTATATPVSPPATPVPEVGADGAEEPDGDDVAAPAAAADRYARRRKNLTRAFIATAVIIGFALYHGMGRQGLPHLPTTKAQAATAAAPTAVQRQQASVTVEGLLAQAHTYYEAHRSYIGWAPAASSGFQAATGTTEVVVAGEVAGVCYYSGIVPGRADQVLSSPQACAAGALAQVQSSLTVNDQATAASDSAQLTAKLASAASAASYWAVHNQVGGAPSFAGLPGLAGVTETVNDHGASVTLKAAAADGACLAETISAANPTGATPGAC